MTALLDTDPDGGPAVVAAEPVDVPRRRPTAPRRAGPVRRPAAGSAAVGGRVPRPPRRSGAAVGGEQWPGMRETAVEVIHRTPGLDGLARLLPTSEAGDIIDEHPTGRAPRLSFNAPVTSSRRFAMARLPIDDVLAVKHAAGVTFNDVVVAVCAGALRRWLLAHDELPTSPTVAMVPILVGGAGAARRRPRRRARRPAADERRRPRPAPGPHAEALRTAKERHAAVPASLMQDVSMFAPPAVAAMAGRLVGALHVRQPAGQPRHHQRARAAAPVHLAGHPLESSHPAMSISDLTPLHIGLQSGADAIGIGAVSCRTRSTTSRLVAAARVELDELVASVTPSRRSRRRTRQPS